LHPYLTVHKRNHLCTWTDELSYADFAFTNYAVGRRDYASVLQVSACDRHCGFLRPQIGVELRFLSVEDAALSSLGLELRLSTFQSGARLLRLRVSEGQQRPRS